MSVSTEPQSTPEVIRLSIEDDEGVRATYPIIHEQIRVGRSENNEVCLNQKNISREHALLIAEVEARRVAVHDLNSYTGIKLNGKRIFDGCYLNFGDYLEIGGYVITLDMEGHDGQHNARHDQGALRNEPEPLPPEKHAKLVVVSNNLAGREYYLNRAELLIGREQADNDLVINHRSISRNHAKIVWKNDNFTIIDLSSSNGVMIGGVATNPAPLTKGVIVQMGLVKFRYVAPGEEYTFNPVDLEVTALDETGSTKKFLGALLVFIIIFFLSRQAISLLSAPQTTSENHIEELQTPIIPNQLNDGQESEYVPTNDDMIEVKQSEKEATEEEATEEEATEKEATEEEATEKEATEKEATEEEATEKEATGTSNAKQTKAKNTK